ncbi:hypothetical protein R1sor_026105 [Riccia sorocarpa]|uniref:Reverse transcriptase zinc-binding domain-containing protein n=1 Tax=Riccia sorocarpa TaxID=122646 RepID=A0ABD3GAG9_9MARC
MLALGCDKKEAGKLEKMMGFEVGSLFRELEAVARANRLITLKDVCQEDRKLDLSLLLTWPRAGQGQAVLDPSVSHWLINVRVGDRSLSEIDGWQWSNGKEVTQGLCQATSHWMGLQQRKNPVHKKPSKWWGVPAIPSDWSRRWRQLWQGASLNRHKLWVWKIVHFGLLTLARTEVWGVTDGTCLMCQSGTETMEHLLWDCRRLRERQAWIVETLQIQEIGRLTLFQAIDKVLQCHIQQPGPMVLLAVYCRICWSERKKVVFDNSLSLLPNTAILETSMIEASAARGKLSGKRGRRANEKDEVFFQSAGRLLREQATRQRRMEGILREVMEEEGLFQERDGSENSVSSHTSSSQESHSDSSSDYSQSSETHDSVIDTSF